jgi:hypothetical protein
MESARLVIIGHVLVSLLFFAAAGQFLLGGELAGAALQAIIGAMIVALGVALSRIVARR